MVAATRTEARQNLARGSVWTISFCANGCDCLRIPLSEMFGQLATPPQGAIPTVKFARTLLEGALMLTGATVYGGCHNAEPPALAAFGSEAWRLLQSYQPNTDQTLLIKRWEDHRTGLIESLQAVAGSGRDFRGLRLKRAAAALAQEFQETVRLFAAKTALVEWDELSSLAQGSCNEAAHHLTEAGLNALRLPLGWRDALLVSAYDRPTLSQLEDLEYIARASEPLLRATALVAMDRVDHPGVVSVASQCITDNQPLLSMLGLSICARRSPQAVRFVAERLGEDGDVGEGIRRMVECALVGLAAIRMPTT